MDRVSHGMLSLGRRVRQVPSIELPSSRQQDIKTRQSCLVFFIPGNPGLVHYYETFLKTLRSLLDEVESRLGSDKLFHIYGQNLIGFDDEDHEVPFGRGGPPFNLEDQVFHFYDRLIEKSSIMLKDGERVLFDKVIIMGHSVGAYISIEVFHRHHDRLKAAAKRTCADSPVTDAAKSNLAGGIMLFPTISHLARSANGQKLDVIHRTPVLDKYAHHVARGFVGLWPAYFLKGVVRWVMGFPEHAVDVTTRFLKSKDGIWQGLHLGKDELRHITEEKWSNDLWEIAEDNTPGASEGDKFFFYFADKDHWVADECRDAFIERRREQVNGRTKIVIDEDKIPHAFCIHHSERVAEKVSGWIQDIVGR